VEKSTLEEKGENLDESQQYRPPQAANKATVLRGAIDYIRELEASSRLLRSEKDLLRSRVSTYEQLLT